MPLTAFGSKAPPRSHTTPSADRNIANVIRRMGQAPPSARDHYRPVRHERHATYRVWIEGPAQEPHHAISESQAGEPPPPATGKMTVREEQADERKKHRYRRGPDEPPEPSERGAPVVRASRRGLPYRQ